MREFTTDELFEELKQDIRGGQQTDVISLQADLLEVATEGDRHWASVRFSGLIRETPGSEPAEFERGLEPGQAGERLERLAAGGHPADALRHRCETTRPPSGGLFLWR